ncbi:hypothetical protein [Actomonas aquatica]|uniref:Transposase n=1 Tax=Actomonas aquatica TaxID=2866162 RepID=A0ABZ1C6T6_9BACT|nr:hypothetical protein [Opitutus sp. WL0086]WRQ87434.1 hypothetical protein K1X11_021685 [Opitutus sp. WL0086]
MASPVIETYCAHFGIESAAFTHHLLARTLHGPARWLRPLLQRFSPEHFTPDLLFLDCVGRVRSRQQLKVETSDFRRDSANRHFSRRVLQLRVSVQAVHDIVIPLLEPTEAHTDRVPTLA